MSWTEYNVFHLCLFFNFVLGMLELTTRAKIELSNYLNMVCGDRFIMAKLSICKSILANKTTIKYFSKALRASNPLVIHAL